MKNKLFKSSIFFVLKTKFADIEWVEVDSYDGIEEFAHLIFYLWIQGEQSE